MTSAICNGCDSFPRTRSTSRQCRRRRTIACSKINAQSKEEYILFGLSKEVFAYLQAQANSGPQCAPNDSFPRRRGAADLSPSTEDFSTNSPPLLRTAWPAHSITREARAISQGETVRPSAPAVLTLITSSNVLGIWTGRSPGFAPLRMRPA